MFSNGAFIRKLLLITVTVVTLQLITTHQLCYDGDVPYRNEYLCNNGTTFACVCYKGGGDSVNDKSLSKKYPDCKTFIKSPSLPVVKLSIEFRSNSDAKMPGEYFKSYKVASTVERYCMNGTHECRETSLPIKKDTNLVVLNLVCKDHLHSTLLYTLAKPMNPKDLTTANTMEPEKIISIMNSTLTAYPWEVISADNKLTEHVADEITVIAKVAPPTQDYFHENIVFFIFLIVIGFVVGLIYVIAIVKVIRDHKRKTDNRKRERNKNPQDTSVATPNYGSINHNTTTAATSSGGVGATVEIDNRKSTSRQSSTVISITGPSSSINNNAQQQQRVSVTYQKNPSIVAPPVVERPFEFVSPLRIGDVGAYEAAEPEYQSPTSLFNYLIDRFKIGRKKLKTSSSTHNVITTSKRQTTANSSNFNDERDEVGGVKKSRTIHQTLSSPGAKTAYILRNTVDDDDEDVNEKLKDFQVQSKSRQNEQAKIVLKTMPEIKIDFEYAQAPVDEDFYPDVDVDDGTTAAKTSTPDFANFDNFPSPVVNGGSSSHDHGEDVDENWPPSKFVTDSSTIAAPIVHDKNLHNSLSAAAILTTSYTEENLIKSETSSLAESRSNSESDLSEHSLTLQPSSDYQPLRESTWSVNRQESK